jgi:hypothetical protein
MRKDLVDAYLKVWQKLEDMTVPQRVASTTSEIVEEANKYWGEMNEKERLASQEKIDALLHISKR